MQADDPADAAQAALFGSDDAPGGPQGLLFAPDFLSRDEERALLAWIATLPLEAALYKGYTARRRIASFGGRFDYDDNRLLAAPPVPPPLWPLRERLARWAGVPPAAFAHALVAAYAPGTPLGWHRDVPDFERVAGVSLGGDAVMRWRRYPPQRGAAHWTLALPPRSAYLMQGEARWGWQHAIAPTPALRHSITLRTLRAAA